MSLTYQRMDEIKYSFNPFNEAQLKQAVGRLAYFFASDMGWVHKNTSDKNNLPDIETQGETDNNE